MKRVALYSRAGNDEALFHQREMLKGFVAEHPDWEVVLDAYDEGVSGDKEERIGLLTIIDGIEANKIDIVASASLSRYYRSSELAHETLNEIAKHGAEVICMDGSEKTPFANLKTLSLEGIDKEFEEAEPSSAMLSPSMI